MAMAGSTAVGEPIRLNQQNERDSEKIKGFNSLKTKKAPECAIIRERKKNCLFF
jgi:hypothetical protein